MRQHTARVPRECRDQPVLGRRELDLGFAEYAVVAWLVLLNLRGVKESVFVLTPIFLVFIVSHVALIGFGVLRHVSDLGHLLPATVQETRGAVSQLGLFGVGVIVLRAFSLGGGTYTGIEAVSNGVAILREPRVENGRKTMLYMASSLAFTPGASCSATSSTTCSSKTARR